MSKLKVEKQRIMEALASEQPGTPEYNALLEQYAKVLEMESKQSVSSDTKAKCATYAGIALLGWFGSEVFGLIKRNYGDNLHP